MTVHCQLENGQIVGVFANPQKFATVELADDDPRVTLAMAFPQGLGLAIKMECERRIFGVVDDNTRFNLLMERDSFTSEEEAVFQKGRAWKNQMIDKCRELIVKADPTFSDDKHWPAPSTEIIALAKRY